MWGTRDPLKPWCETLPACFESPVIIRHGRGHVVPQLDEAQLQTLRSFLSTQLHSPSL